MTADDFSSALRSLGWKQADLCRRVSVSKSTASRWWQEGPPPWVGEYLGVMIELDRLHRLYIRPPKPVKPRSSSDQAPPPPSERAAKMARRLQEGPPWIDQA